LLIRNEDYWGPKPAYKYVRVRIIPEQATQIAELMSGGVDIIKAVPPDQMDVINKSGQARTTTSPILRTAMIQLDQAGRSGPNPSRRRTRSWLISPRPASGPRPAWSARSGPSPI